MAKKAKNTRTFFLKGKVHKDITPEQYAEIMTGKTAAPVKEEAPKKEDKAK